MSEANDKANDKASPIDGLVMSTNSSCLGELIEKPATLEEWKEKAEKLWQLLDDIDTYGDMYTFAVFRPQPEINGYFKAVNKKAAQRHDILQSDGYKLFNT